MKKDYRNTEYCSSLKDIDKKKKELNTEICKEHPRAKIIYNQIKDADKKYKAKFMKIYNYKCGYCGNSIWNLSKTLFEVDHYICASSFVTKEEAGKIENLVLSCYDCNRAKSKFPIEHKYIDKVNPDLEEITKVFIRDDMYYIKISQIYKNDRFIRDFYKQLRLGYETRRLDFLLMNLQGLCHRLGDRPEANKLSIVLNKLQQKRNLTNCKM